MYVEGAVQSAVDMWRGGLCNQRVWPHQRANGMRGFSRVLGQGNRALRPVKDPTLRYRAHVNSLAKYSREILFGVNKLPPYPLSRFTG